jgi:hypothetical protein
MDIRRALFKAVLLCIIFDNHNTFVATLAPATTEQPITASQCHHLMNLHMYSSYGTPVL